MKPISRQDGRVIHDAVHGPYRPDIDGLRTLAVLPVVLNHVGVRGFMGGFVGVDIFFVISGFLISGILTRDIQAGRFRITEFYRRRVLRIFPALFVVLAAVTAATFAAMLPGEMIRYARSLGATILFGSNILFWSEAGYFDQASHIKPLLHTWSLAIEEQFYILWPLLLLLTARARRGVTVGVIAAITLISLGVSIVMVGNSPTDAFYWLPARAWELSIGALVATMAHSIRWRWLNEALGVIGLGMILYAIKFYNQETAFPGAAALVPCLGAALLIATGATGTWVARLLSIRPVTFIGKISYSLYLWHWPVIVFAQIGLFLPKTPAVMAGEIALSIALATLSWRYVERPFRTRPNWPTRSVLLGALAAMALGLGVTAIMLAGKGFPQRFTPKELAVAAYEDLDGDALYRRGTCFVVMPGDRFDPKLCLTRREPAKPALLLLGDSHGAHLWPGLAQQRARYEILQATHSGCKPVLYPDSATGECQRFFRTMLGSWIPRHPPSALLIAARWRLSDLPLVDATLRDPRVRRANPILIGPIPQYSTALPRLLVFSERRHDPDLAAQAYDFEVFTTDRALNAAAHRHGIPYISLVQTLCGTNVNRCGRWAEGVPLQFDYGHLTGEGSRETVARIMPRIDREVALQHR